MKLFIFILSLTVLFLFINKKVDTPITYGIKERSENTDQIILSFNKEWNTQLHKYVDNLGNVDYKNWVKSQGQLDLMIQKYLSKIDTNSLKDNQKMAFFINVYNLLTIRAMLRFYPISSIMDKVSRIGGFHFWKDTYIQFSNTKFSLDQIEHKVLRPMHDYRVHFAIVCASKSCPPLRNEAFTASKLQHQLKDQALKFFSLKQNFDIDKKEHIIYLSSILKWFSTDFSKQENLLIPSISTHLSKQDQDYLNSVGFDNFKITYLNYNWAINSK